MSEQEEELRFEGIVHVSRFHVDCWATIKCSDGMEWVITYDARSPYHVFADRRVAVSGKRCPPPVAHILLKHFRVSMMRLVEVTPDAEIIEVGARQQLSGRFERGGSDTGETTLFFVTEKGDAFLVANDPAEATVGCSVTVLAYPVQLSPSIAKSTEQYLWIICIPRDCHLDAESGEIRFGQGSAEPGATADRPRD
jgi:hypothetical protein